MTFGQKTLVTLQSSLPVQLYICYCFVTSGLIVNFIQLLTWIFVKPFNKKLYRILNYHLYSLLWSQLTFLYSWWSQSDLKVYADPKDVEQMRQEYGICLPNHRYEIDWLAALVFAQKLSIIGGTKIVAKKSLSFLPVFGWSWLFSESIFLRRAWEKDKKVLEHDIQQLVNHYPDNYHFYIVIACEGTRYTEAKRIESMEYARKKNLPELKYHILPRTKGLTMIMQGAKGKVPAVYNFMLGFSKDSAPPKLQTLLSGRKCKAHLYLKRIPMSEIPYDDDEKCVDWIHKLYQEKDRLYEYFIQHDTFNGAGVSEVSIPKNCSDLLIQLFWIVIVAVPSLIWFCQFLFNSTWFAKMIFVSVTCIAYVVIQLMIGTCAIKTEKKK